MIVVSDFNQYPEVMHLKTINAGAVTGVLSEIFGRFGNPQTLKTDNASPPSKAIA